MLEGHFSCSSSERTTEDVRFELTELLAQLNGLANRRLQPLGQSSKISRWRNCPNRIRTGISTLRG